MNRKTASYAFDIGNYLFLGLFALFTIVPFVYIILGSFASTEDFLRREFSLIPRSYSLEAYRYIFTTNTVFRGLLVSVFVTVFGTAINLIFTIMMAYPLARKHLLGRNKMMFLVVFTMLFNGGIIPTFLVVKSLGMLNSLWSLTIPGAISAFYLIILKNFFQQIPEGIEDSAKIDGCNDIQTLIRLVVPLSMPAIATFTLFYAVGHWNTYFAAILYINDADKWPIQVLLRQIVILASGGFGDSSNFNESFVIPAQSVKMGVIVISTLPILLFYPLLQKHFAKGILLGSVKG
jgi:putative aldouronate transport system permease protein